MTDGFSADNKVCQFILNELMIIGKRNDFINILNFKKCMQLLDMMIVIFWTC